MFTLRRPAARVVLLDRQGRIFLMHAEDPVDSEDQALGGDRRIDPIEVGRAWTYDVKVLGWYPLCSDGTFTARTLASVHVGGREGKRVESLCNHAGSFVYSDNDVLSSRPPKPAPRISTRFFMRRILTHALPTPKRPEPLAAGAAP